MDDTRIKMHMFLDACQDVEQLIAEIYHFFADQFREEMKICLLWRKTALEEKNHAQQVKLAKKLAGSIIWVNIDTWRQVSGIREKLSALSARLRQFPPSIEEAFSYALMFESKLDHFHMQNAIMLEWKAGSDLFVAMMNEDRNHLAALETALEEFKNGQGQVRSAA
jgi:hypothetical protein